MGEDEAVEIVCEADQICRKLSRFMAGSRKIALIGVGNLLRKDDGVGINILMKLRDRIGDKGQIIFIESHTTPENYFSLLEREKPSCILFIDAADAQLPPGTVFLADLDQVEELTISTHSIPLTVYREFINTLFEAQTLLLGVQPEDVSFGEGLTKRVAEGANEAVRILAITLKKI